MSLRVNLANMYVLFSCRIFLKIEIVTSLNSHVLHKILVFYLIEELNLEHQVHVFSMIVIIWNWIKLAPFKGASASWFTPFLPFTIYLHMAGYTQSFSWLSCGALVIFLDYPTSQTMTEKKKESKKWTQNQEENIK